MNENVTQGKADYHEGIDFYRPVEKVLYIDAEHPEKGYELLQGENQWPEHPKGFREAIEELWGGLERVGKAMMIAMAWALGYEGSDGDGDEETERVFLKNTEKTFWVGRVIGYPELKTEGEEVSCGEHSDYGCTTFLLTDGTKGALQVRGKDGKWVQADPVEGCYVVNIGGE